MRRDEHGHEIEGVHSLLGVIHSGKINGLIPDWAGLLGKRHLVIRLRDLIVVEHLLKSAFRPLPVTLNLLGDLLERPRKSLDRENCPKGINEQVLPHPRRKEWH